MIVFSDEFVLYNVEWACAHVLFDVGECVEGMSIHGTIWDVERL